MFRLPIAAMLGHTGGMAMRSLVALAGVSAARNKGPRHMTGRGRKTLYTYHHGPNGGSHPVPGGGLKEQARRVRQAEAIAAKRAARVS